MKKLLIKQSMMLTGDDAGLGNLIARIHNTHIKRTFKRRDAVIIKNIDNGASIIRYVMGGSYLFEGKPSSLIAFDYDGYDTLGLPYKPTEVIDCNLQVRKATVLEKYLYLSKHPDLSIQLSIRLGLLGAVLGFAGLVLGIISLI